MEWEQFNATQSNTVRLGEYELETWLAHGAHMLRFQVGPYCAVEVITPRPNMCPRPGRLLNIPVAGERDHFQPIGDRIRYTVAVQTEQLRQHLFDDETETILKLGESTDGLVDQHTDPTTGSRNLSVICVQTLRTEAHVQTWHLDASCGLVVRGQTIFDLKPSTPIVKTRRQSTNTILDTDKKDTTQSQLPGEPFG